MKTVFVRGKGKVNFSQNDFIAKGGEGEVFGQGRTIYKIYLDKSRMIPEAKIRELQQINHKGILKPQQILLDSKNNPIGFTMDWVKDSLPLCKLFTNSFRDKNNVKPQTVNELVDTMREMVYKVHDSKCLMVDGNEFNYLVNDKFTKPYFIDVDSYQTPNFKATAIMPSIKDYHTTPFSTLSDWYSFAIVACQLFVGIHPFKGSHPDFKKRDMENRMRKNVSIFNSQCGCPPTVRDFSLIPSEYMDWFVDLFENGKRELPPTELGVMVAKATKTLIMKSTEHFDIKLLSKFKNVILYHENVLGIEITKTTKETNIGNKTYDTNLNTECIITERDLIPILIKLDNGILTLKNTKTGVSEVCQNIKANDKMIVNNMLFCINKGNVSRIDFREFDGKVVVSIGKTWNIMPQSSIVFSNVVYQSVLGKPFLFIPIDKKRSISVPLPELDGCKVINMKHQSKVCVIIVHKDGEYKRLTLKFNEDYSKYDCRENTCDFTDINFVVLGNGVVILISDDEEMEIFSNNIDHMKIKEIRNKVIRTDMKLCCDGTQARFFQDDKIYTIKTK